MVGCAEGSGLEERVRPAGWCVEQFAAVVEEGQSTEGGQSPNGGVFGGMRPDQRLPSLYQMVRLGHAPEVSLTFPNDQLPSTSLDSWVLDDRAAGRKAAEVAEASQL